MKLRIISIAILISLSLSVTTACVIKIFSGFGWISLLLCFFVFLAINALLLFGVFKPSSSIFGYVFWKGLPDLRSASITFDDGPNEPYTSQILGILRELDVKATFFVVGENISVFPTTLQREVQEGHEIGNHTYNHEVLPLKSPGYVHHEIKRTSKLIQETAGISPKLFRAPHGWRNPWMNSIVKSLGLTVVAWTIGVFDTDRPGAEEIVRRTLKRLESGSILLFHDGRGTEHGSDSSQLVEALPTIIREAQRMGYQFLTLSEMMAEAKTR